MTAQRVLQQIGFRYWRNLHRYRMSKKKRIDLELEVLGPFNNDIRKQILNLIFGSVMGEELFSVYKEKTKEQEQKGSIDPELFHRSFMGALLEDPNVPLKVKLASENLKNTFIEGVAKIRAILQE